MAEEKMMVVLASRNKGKIAEMRELLKDFPVELKSLDDFGPVPDVIEDGETFDDNAYKKAAFTAKVLGIPAISDDSGLEVEALGGAPGVFSARYAGENASDQDNVQKLLNEMKGKENRKAAFHCVISVAVPSGPALTYEGRCEGEIIGEPKGDSGFGYDPVFYYPEFGKTFAESDPVEKNSVSHRGRALAEMAGEFSKVLVWLRQRMAEIKPPKPDHSEFEHNDWSGPKMVQ
jgi:XTP/dITP diphosphohydrolase